VARAVLTRRKLREGEAPHLGPVLGAVETCVFRVFWAMASRLPPARAARLAGRAFALLAPRVRKHSHVRDNLERVLADRSDEAREAVAKEVWWNLGAVFAEYPHLARIAREGLEVEVHPASRPILESGRQAIYVTGHLANWELAAAALVHAGVPITVIYAALTQAALDARLHRYRVTIGCEFVDRKQAGARAMVAAWARGRSLGFVADQRVDSGVALPLFGAPAWSTTTPARIALRFDAPLVPLVVERLAPAQFRVRIEAPIERPAGVTGRAAAVAMTAAFLGRLEAWIGAHPGQWLCTKRRWPKVRSPEFLSERSTHC